MRNIHYLKTIYYNYKFCGLKGLLTLPLIIHRGVVMKDTAGKITFLGCMRRATLRLGSERPLATRDMRFERTIIDISGELQVGDNVHIAPGSRISVNTGGVLRLGSNFNSTGNCTIICDTHISFGDSCLLSWDIQIMDSDFHKIYNNQNQLLNPPAPIVIGSNVWIGSRVTILKGAAIADGCVIGAASVVTKKFTRPDCVIAGSGNNCKIIKSDIHWQK